MSITKRTPSEKAFRLAKQLADEANDLYDLIDAAMILTLLVHKSIFDMEGEIETIRFMENWTEVVRHNVARIILKVEE